LDKIG